jgi:uncharacterized membrane protein
MKKNMGSIDRVIRVVLAVAFGVLVLTGTVNGVLAIILGVLAVVFLGTAAIGFCPLYAPFGISTCPRKQ